MRKTLVVRRFPRQLMREILENQEQTIEIRLSNEFAFVSVEKLEDERRRLPTFKPGDQVKLNKAVRCHSFLLLTEDVLADKDVFTVRKIVRLVADDDDAAERFLVVVGGFECLFEAEAMKKTEQTEDLALTV